MTNTILTPTVIARETLLQTKNALVMANLVHREYKNEFVKVGSTVNIRRPVDFTVTDGATASVQDVTEVNTSIVVDQRKHVAWGFSSQDLTLSIDEYSERYIKPAARQLANNVDRALMALYSKVWNFVGTPGTVPSTFLNVSDAAARLDNSAVPDDGRRYACYDPTASYKIADSIRSSFIDGKNKTALETGRIGNIATFEAYKSQNLTSHTVGALGGTPLVNGASQNTTYAASGGENQQTLVTDGWSNSITGVLKAGDVITLAGVFAVNPVGKQTLPYLQQFVVKADANSNGSGQATLTISPAIISSGAYQNVSAAPADNAAISVVTGTAATAYAQNMAFHKNAFGLVMVPLEMPDSVGFKAQENADGISIRVIKDYDFTNDIEQIRLDILYGVKLLDGNLACRHTS